MRISSRIISLIVIVSFALPTLSQKLKIAIEQDSTFNAAEDYAKTSSGFDVDIRKVNEVQIGLQLAQDIAASDCNDDDIEKGIAKKSYYRQRADLMLSAALPEKTNVYSILSFVNGNGDVSEGANVVVSNFEIEHYFNNHCKFRMGRLINSVSESQFFGRIALEETSAHVFARKVFINDALELDGTFNKEKGPVYFIGVKPVFKPLNFKAAYAGIHKTFTNGLRLHGIASVNRQFTTDLRKYMPTVENTNTYFSFESEVARRTKASAIYLNAGFNIGSLGLIPHSSGAYDYIRQLSPLIERKGDSFRDSFTASTGFRLSPSKMNPKLKSLFQVGAECEVQGALSSKFTALNVCAFCKINITRRMVLTYNCTPQFIWQDFNPSRPHFVGGMVNYLRLSVTVGKPTRMLL